MKQYTVTGMSCAACSARVEKAVSKVPGVKSCAVSLLTNSMGVEGTATADSIIRAVRDAGYDAAEIGQQENTRRESLLDNKDTKVIRKRLIFSAIFLLILMYISMGTMLFDLPLPEALAGNILGKGIIELVLAAVVMVINRKIFISGFKSVIHGAPNMDTLVSLGASISFIYSTFNLIAISYNSMPNNTELVEMYAGRLYFESAAMILTLITVGKFLESVSKGRTTDALKKLMKLQPETAIKKDGDQEIEVLAKELKIGDLYVVRPGSIFPVDGIILEGESAVDESSLTGESIPVDKKEGNEVASGTVNLSGHLVCKATKVGEDTTIAKIINMVSEASSTKAPIAKIADKVSGFFVPVVIGIALITFIIWMIIGKPLDFSITRAISVLVISCPCALGLATPVAIMVGSGIGARNGILFKTAESLETTGKTAVVVLDKTGTVTNGVPKVTDIFSINIDDNELLKFAASIEDKSEHPLAKAVIEKAHELKIDLLPSEKFRSHSGYGVSATIEGHDIYGGKLDFIQKYADITDEIKSKAEEYAKDGKTAIYFAKNKEVIGLIAVADTIKPDSIQAIKELNNMGIRVYMVTGDNHITAETIGKKLGIENIRSEILPGDKEKEVRRLKKYGKVVMVGDGINDAPALTSADVGMAIGAGTDIALDAADVVLVNSKLSDVIAAIRLGRKTLRNIKENLFWAFIYNIICIPLAAGVWTSILGWDMNPMIGAAAMSLSSICVVTNALRLNLCDIHSNKRDKKMKANKEIEEMEKVFDVEGMMCVHCEARVKKAVESIDGVTSVKASHETGKVEVAMLKDISDDIIIQKIENEGYSVK